MKKFKEAEIKYLINQVSEENAIIEKYLEANYDDIDDKLCK